MCGIVGLINKNKNGFSGIQQKMFYQLLYADNLRGDDATGVIAIDKSGDFSIMKEASPAPWFISQFEECLIDKKLYSSGQAAIGHNRAKTIGANSDENAHPFVEAGTFAMVHNGTLRNHKLTNEVDSHDLTILFQKAMAEKEWKPAMEKAIGNIQGAFAVVWYDQTTNTIGMIRNVERPLSFIITANSIVFGSELSMIQWIAHRNGEKIEKSVICEVHKLYTFDLEKAGGEYSETFLSPITKVGTPKGYTNGTTTAVKVSKSGTRTVKPTGGMETVSKLFPIDDTAMVLSKSGYKKLRARIFRKLVRFDIEDIIHTSGSHTALVLGVSINGAHDLCEIRHSIRVVVNLKELGFDNVQGMWANGVEFEGIVADTEYDADTAGIIIRMDKVKNVTEQSQIVTH